jgi:hypothetical protein
MERYENMPILISNVVLGKKIWGLRIENYSGESERPIRHRFICKEKTNLLRLFTKKS